MPTPVLIDCDPGHDDAAALLLALGADTIEVRAVTTVAGNQRVDRTTENALRVLALASRSDVPVSRGMAGPLVGPPTFAGEVHGESGMDGFPTPPLEGGPTSRHAVEELRDHLETSTEPMTVIALGPLTNLAVLFSMYPETTSSIEEIVLMGGSVAGGNVTPAAEFNIFADPEAAAAVFDAEVSVTMVGLNVTWEACIPTDHFSRFSELGTEVGESVHDMLEYLLPFHRERYGWEAVPVHDVCAVAAVIRPELLETEPMAVRVELSGTHTRGATVCDRWDALDQPENVQVGVGIDDETVIDVLLDGLTTYGEQ